MKIKFFKSVSIFIDKWDFQNESNFMQFWNLLISKVFEKDLQTIWETTAWRTSYQKTIRLKPGNESKCM